MIHDREPTPPSASGADPQGRTDGRRLRGGDPLWVALLVLGAVLVWDARVTAPANPYLMGSGDAFGYFLPAYEYEARRLAAGSFPFWNPYQGAGVPFLATLQPGALYPARALTLVMSPKGAMGWSAFAHVLLGLLGTYALCRRLGTGGAAAAMAGVVFATAVALPWLHTASLLEPGAWLPLLALAVVVVLDGGGWGSVLFLGLAGAMPVLAGGYQPALYTLYGLAVFALAVVLDRWARGARQTARGVGRLAVAGLLAAATAMPQVLPTLAWSANTLRQTRMLADVQMMMLFTEAGRWDRLGTFFVRRTSSDLCHLSIPVVALAAVAIVGARPLGLVLGLGAIVTAGAALQHPGSIFFPLYKAMPGLGIFRFPSRILLLTGLCTAVAAALGLTTLTRTRVLAAPLRRHAVEAAALLAVVLLLVWPYASPVRLPWSAGGEIEVLKPHFVPGAQRPTSEYRVWVPGGRLDLRVGEFVRQGMREGVRVVQDYEPLSSRRLGAFLYAAVGLPPPAPDAVAPFTGAMLQDRPIMRPVLLDLVAARTIVMPTGVVPPAGVPGWTLVGSRGDLGTYRNDNALPRAYVVDRARFVADEADALAVIGSRDFDGHGEVVLVGAPATDAEQAVATAARAPARPARIAIDDPEHVAIDVDGVRPSVLVLADAHAPGWEATVDGVPRRLWQANYLVRGVALEPGDRRVELRYRAPGFALGVAIAFTAWGTVLAALAGVRMRRRRHST